LLAHDNVTSFRTKRTDAITPDHFTRISVWLDDDDFLIEALNPLVQRFGLSLGFSDSFFHRRRCLAKYQKYFYHVVRLSF